MHDIVEAKRQCEIFINEIAGLRKNRSDEEVARQILESINRGEYPSSAARKRLSKWCHTSGLYTRGMPIAQLISIAIYGHVIPRED